MRKEVWIGWLASLVEAYNIAIYSFLVPTLLQMGQQSSLLWSYSLVFIGSFFYPIGAIYYGFMGDKRGRQKLCVYTTLGLGIATGMMGLLPLQGKNVTWLFLACICAQYFFSGGEYHGSIVFSLEHSESKKRGMASGLSCLFAVMGLVLANGCARIAFLHPGTFWIRFCFFLGAVGGLVSYLLKKYCHETPAFTTLPRALLEESWFSVIRFNLNKIVKITAVMSFFLASYSFIFIFLQLHFPASKDTLISLVVYGVLLSLAGYVADYLGIQKAVTIGSFLFCLVIIPICFLCKNLLAMQLVLIASICLVIGPIHTWMLHQFQAHHRCRGIFIGSGIATSIFGGSAVPICLMIYERSHSLGICSLYPLSLGLISLLCLRGKAEEIPFVKTD